MIDYNSWNEKIQNGWRNGYNYVTGETYNPALGSIIATSQYIQDGVTWLNETDIGAALQTLGFAYASYRMMTKNGPVMVENEKASKAKMPKVEIPEQSLRHADVGDFTVNPSTGKVSKMKGGGHGQSNIDFLKENGFEVNIEKTYPNGVRTGNVPNHKVKAKRTGNNQSWFPENWSSKDIKQAGQHVANQPSFAKAKDGEVIYGEFKGVRVGVIKTDGKPATIFPDASKQP